jgi:hypothetical protein
MQIYFYCKDDGSFLKKVELRVENSKGFVSNLAIKDGILQDTAEKTSNFGGRMNLPDVRNLVEIISSLYLFEIANAIGFFKRPKVVRLDHLYVRKMLIQFVRSTQISVYTRLSFFRIIKSTSKIF